MHRSGMEERRKRSRLSLPRLFPLEMCKHSLDCRLKCAHEPFSMVNPFLCFDSNALVHPVSHHTLRSANSELAEYNRFSAEQHSRLSSRFSTHMKTLKHVHSDLFSIFQRVRALRSQLVHRYPELESALEQHEAARESELEASRNVEVLNRNEECRAHEAGTGCAWHCKLSCRIEIFRAQQALVRCELTLCRYQGSIDHPPPG